VASARCCISWTATLERIRPQRATWASCWARRGDPPARGHGQVLPLGREGHGRPPSLQTLHVARLPRHVRIVEPPGQGQASPGLTTTSTPVRASSIRRASEHASIANLDAKYGPVPGSVNRPRVPPAPKGFLDNPARRRAPAQREDLLHRNAILPCSQAAQRGQPSQTPEPRPASSTLAQPGGASQEEDRQKTGRSHFAQRRSNPAQ